MKKKMRVMAMILAAALCVSSAPFSVSADEMETEVVTESAADVVENVSANDSEQVENADVETEANQETDVDVEAKAEEESVSKDASMAVIVDSGTCGENVTWTLDDEGTLIISGTGEMDSPWFDYNFDIKKVIINEGVTSIGGGAFMGCDNLTSITMPNSVTSIGENAFFRCSNLTSIAMPNSITSIGEYAFFECISLTNITMPNSVTSIGDGAFFRCSNLTNITMSNSITSIGYAAFNGCSNLTSITIPTSVASIGDSAFFRCSNLTYITMPNSITSIGENAFYECYSLKDIYYTGSEEEWNKIAIENYNEQLLNANIHFNSTGTVTPSPEDTISVVVEEGPEISEMTYLAMSDAAYLKRMDSFKGEGVLGDKAKEAKKDDIRLWEGNICNNIPEEYGLTWGDVYKQCLSTWSVLDYARDDDIGFHAVTFRRDNQIVVAYEGSGKLETELQTDWLNDDFGMAFRKEETPQMVAAINYARKIYNQYKEDYVITLTGHSLGGGLAILAANATNLKAVPFDSAPTVEVGYYLLWMYLGEAFKGIDKWTYSDIINESCFVGTYEKTKKNYKAVETQNNSGNFLAHHARESIITFDKNNSKFSLSEFKENDSKEYTVHDKYILNVRHTNIPNPIFWRVQLAEWIVSSGTLVLGNSLKNTINSRPGVIHTDVVYGGEGVDRLNTYQGDDYLIGGPGDDKLDGNTGNDTYVYFKDQGKDTITDYQGNDIIKLYGFSDSDDIECENLNDSATHCCITCNGERIINISKNRSLNPLNSFKVEVMDDAGNVKKEVKIQDWNTWKNVRTYKIACPVNVEIYDADNNLVMTLEDGVEDTIYTEYGNFYCAFNEETNEYDKMVDLVSDYSIKIVGNNDGNMDISVFETDETGKETEYAANDIPVSNQEIFAIDDNTKKLVSDKQEVELSEVKNDKEETGTDDNNEDAGADIKDSAQNMETNAGSTVTTKPVASGSASAAVSAPAASKLKKVTAGKKKATLKWKKVSGATGYEIQYGTKKNFKKAKTKTIKKAKTVKTTIKKLKVGKKYYFRIRTYKMVNGVKYYSTWSKAKKVKIK